MPDSPVADSPVVGATGVRVRFCPSPTGDPHVGMLRTALFNWAFARHVGGTFVFRIEDTDAARDSEESYQALVDALRWLGLDWDEGPEVGGDVGPYRQSRRSDIYAHVAASLAAAGRTYECFCTQSELTSRREHARAQGRESGYDGHCRALRRERIDAYRAEGRSSVVRFAMPDQDWEWDDLVRGQLMVKREFVADFAVIRANGDPLYTLVNPVDDALMGITHVLRGEDLLSSTPRQIALHMALVDLGINQGGIPRFGHLPYVMGEGNKKLSKRDPASNFSTYPAQGFLPEALANYLALLGWSFGGDREFFSLTEMAEVFDISRVNPSPAKFDIKKCTAINASWIRVLDNDDIAARVLPFLIDAGVLPAQPTAAQCALVKTATPLITERLELLSQAVGMLGFLFADQPGCLPFAIDSDALALVQDRQARPVLQAAVNVLSHLETWDVASIQAALRESLIDDMGIKPKLAFTPLRVAVTGRRVSPPLFESMELLGREVTLARLMAAPETYPREL